MSNTELLDGFVAWARQVSERIRSKRINTDLEICSPTSNRAANLHIDGDDFMARITFWADGSYHAETLDVTTATSAFSRHGQLFEIAAIETEFKDFFDHMRAHLTNG
jgi:hypothetical protein